MSLLFNHIKLELRPALQKLECKVSLPETRACQGLPGERNQPRQKTRPQPASFSTNQELSQAIIRASPDALYAASGCTTQGEPAQYTGLGHMAEPGSGTAAKWLILHSAYPGICLYKVPRSSCSRSIASNKALKFPLPKERAPSRCMIS